MDIKYCMNYKTKMCILNVLLYQIKQKKMCILNVLLYHYKTLSVTIPFASNLR